MHFSPGRRGLIVRRLTALGRETSGQRNGALTSSCLPCLTAGTIAKETKSNAADVTP
jgi:hypothetical protein